MAKTVTSLIERISADPQVCSGSPCIRGTRIPVEVILEQLALGATAEELVVDYPYIETDDIRACLAYATSLIGRPDPIKLRA